MLCKFDHSRMVRGKVLQPTASVNPGLHEVVTITINGPAKLVDCWKCPHCGYSVTTYDVGETHAVPTTH